MRRLHLSLLLTALAVLCSASTASAEFGLSEFDVTFTDAEGKTVTQAGSHPYEMTSSLRFNTTPTGLGGEFADEPAKDIVVDQLPGFIGNPTAVPRCETADFLTEEGDSNQPSCQDASALGITSIQLANALVSAPPLYAPVYNLERPPGVAAKVGFWIQGNPVTIEVSLSESPPYNIVASVTNVTQFIEVTAATLTFWGTPADPRHDPLRGQCLGTTTGGSQGKCKANVSEVPFLTMPRACHGPLETSYAIDSWTNPGKWVEGSVLTHDEIGNPQGMSGCGKLEFSPQISAQPTSQSAETGTGLDFNVDVNDEGLANPAGIAQSEVKRAEITLPPGMTINPSVGEGLAVCTPAQLARETAFSDPGEGCPNASNLGTLHVVTPLIDESIDGSIFLAQQDDASTTTPGAENPFDTLIALYFVFKNPRLGVIVKEPVKVEPDPQTGQLVVTLDDNAQIPFSHFNAHLRTGARAALVTPPACGTYETQAKFYPWANPAKPLTTTASFKVTGGIGGGPCPPGGVPPFDPDYQAGSINNNAGSFSPFYMRLIREDGEQNMTKFSSILPPGVLGSLAGVSKCPDAAVEVAKSKTGRQEIASPSCPASSLIGHTLAGAGVGSALTYVKGYVYLGGPYKGAPLSVISITPAVAGPFDADTVVVRLGLDLNPKTAEVEVDGAASDPIPHILKGIVLKVRDLRVYVDRPNFTLNPTSCDESSAKATLFGSYLNVFDPADDVPVALSTRYQAANCLNLGFKPKLALNLKGGTKRGGHPGLTATYTPRKGDANIEGLVVRLPRSAFLDQAHIKTICTRVQFAADACPENARYGFIRAWTPLLEEPLAGPVWLRSSNHKLPDLVFDLHGLVDVEVSTRIDSARGGIRATVENSPDAPLSKVVLQMQGAKKGLIVNSRDLCVKKSRANVQFSGHNGKQVSANPVMRAQCGGKGKAKRAR
ncbi:MAG: hypothetical protein WA687_00170 [Solirubrobacterales bacterium]